MTNLTLVSQILSGGDPITITSQLEGMLYSKAGMLVEGSKLDLASRLLNEADPKPAVWKDHDGNPILPKQGEWLAYFEAMAASHVKAQLDAAKDRWETAGDKARELAQKADSASTTEAKRLAKIANAEFKALSMEIRAAESALKQKSVAGSVLAKKQALARSQRVKSIHGAVNTAARGVFGGSPMMGHAVSQITNAVMNHVEGQKGGSGKEK